MAAIRIDNISKAYGAVEVLKDFRLEVKDGEFVVLVGPSGCGKSTMLKILAGLEQASAGEIFIGERDVTDAAPGARDLAMVFQNYALYPHLTVRRNMGFGLKMRRMDRREIDRRVEETARILAIHHLLERRPRELSGGQRQRVALGRAIVREPLAFLMDEPLSNLDAKLRVQMRAEISALHKRLGVTTIYVTHDQTEAMTMADRIVIMREGEIQQIADPDTMYGEPVNLFVAGFIGSPGMNFLSAEVTAGNGAPALKLWHRKVAVPRYSQALSSYVGKRVIAGIRPEHIGRATGSFDFSVVVHLVESLGSEKYVYFGMPPEHQVEGLEFTQIGEEKRGDLLIARLSDAGPIATDESMELGFDPDRLHLFDAATHRRLA
jgi:multiple sugar transport system ATP-binding protein